MEAFTSPGLRRSPKDDGELDIVDGPVSGAIVAGRISAEAADPPANNTDADPRTIGRLFVITIPPG
jgi:hypothetical protein